MLDFEHFWHEYQDLSSNVTWVSILKLLKISNLPVFYQFYTYIRVVK